MGDLSAWKPSPTGRKQCLGAGKQDAGDPGFDPWVRKIPWRRKWQPTSVFLPGESHGQRSLVGYSPWGHKELDMTKRLTHKQDLGILSPSELHI